MRTNIIRRVIPAIFILLVVAAFVYLYVVSNGDDGTLQASGTVEVVELTIAPEVPGRVAEVLVDEGESVEAGQVLVRLDDELMQAQRARLQAAIQAAEATVSAAETQVTAARHNYRTALQAALTAAAPARDNAWRATQPDQFEEPVWYFTQTDQLGAARQYLDDAQGNLRSEQADLDDLIDELGLAEAEQRLAQAQTAFNIAQELRLRAFNTDEDENEALRDYADDLYDAALDDLEDAQSEIDELLTDDEADQVEEARARVAVAQAQVDEAWVALAGLETGQQAPQVESTRIAMQQAEAGLESAQASQDQLEAELDLLDLQIERLDLTSPVDGVVLRKSVEVGEVVATGAGLMSIGQLDELHITVYLPEDRYGQLALGDTAEVTVDSYPDQIFEASIIRIADQAEFTPRNVQTEEGRRTTVFAVELSVSDPNGLLKPGMPADVDFGLE
ncbi:MAG: efflux RND transporter periplasmic adaptor subunit [Anaerolineales bacterium]|jgi:multidrug resistance efflux pump